MENEWDVMRNDRGWPAGDAGMGMLRITLLFGSAAVALALIIAPIADSQTQSQMRPIGSTHDTGASGGGTLHDPQSVLQSPERSASSGTAAQRRLLSSAAGSRWPFTFLSARNLSYRSMPPERSSDHARSSAF